MHTPIQLKVNAKMASLTIVTKYATEMMRGIIFVRVSMIVTLWKWTVAHVEVCKMYNSTYS